VWEFRCSCVRSLSPRSLYLPCWPYVTAYLHLRLFLEWLVPAIILRSLTRPHFASNFQPIKNLSHCFLDNPFIVKWRAVLQSEYSNISEELSIRITLHRKWIWRKWKWRYGSHGKSLSHNSKPAERGKISPWVRQARVAVVGEWNSLKSVRNVLIKLQRRDWVHVK